MDGRIHPNSHPQCQRCRGPDVASTSPENRGQYTQPLHHSQPASTSPKYSTLRTISWKILPATFMILFLLTGTMLLMYALVLHLPLPPTPAIVISITFGVIIVLFIFTRVLLYLLERRKRHSSNDVENHTKPTTPNTRSKEWTAENPNSWLERFHNETFMERVRERWDTWMDYLSKLRGWRPWGARPDDKTPPNSGKIGQFEFKESYAGMEGERHKRGEDGIIRPYAGPVKSNKGDTKPTTSSKAPDQNKQSHGATFPPEAVNVFLDQHSSVASSWNGTVRQSTPHQSTARQSTAGKPSAIRQMDNVHPVSRTSISHQESTKGSILEGR